MAMPESKFPKQHDFAAVLLIAKRLLVQVKEMQWSSDVDGDTAYCHYCHRASWDGHSQGCDVGILIKDANELLMEVRNDPASKSQAD